MGLESLLASYVALGHEPAIAELVRRTRPRLLAVARRIGAQEDAEDSVQTAYLSLVRQGAIAAPVLPWLMTAVVRIAYAAKAARARQAALATKLSRAPREPSASPAQGAVEREEAERLRQCVDQLPAAYRDAAVLHYFQGLTTPEVAQLLGITDAAVRKRLERARLLLKGRLDARALGLILAIPWLIKDAAGTAWGGIAVKKSLSLAAAVLLLSAGTATVVVLDRGTAPEAPRPRTLAVQPTPADAPGPPMDPSPEPRGRYFGVVVDPENRPVAGARVELRKQLFQSGEEYHTAIEDTGPEAKVRVETDLKGRFALDPGGAYPAIELHAVAEGYGRAMVRAMPGTETRIVLPAGGALRVAVRDEAGAPVAGATVFLYDGQRPLSRRYTPRDVLLRQRTDESGETSFPLAPGPYAVVVRAEGLVPYYGEPVTVEREGVRIDVVLGVGTTALVAVKDEGGAPVEGAQVELRGPLYSGAKTSTDAEGRCRIGGIAPPDADADYWYRMMWWEVAADGYALAEGCRVVTAEAGTERIDVTLSRGVPVRIRVVDGDGRPLKRASVHGSYQANAAKPMQRGFGGDTGADGWADLGRFLPGERTINVDSGRGGLYESCTLQIRIGTEPFEEVVTLTRTDCLVSGTVLDPEGKPVSGGDVGFAPEGATFSEGHNSLGSRIEADGTFTIKRAAAGPGDVWVRANGYAIQKAPVSLAPGERREGFVLRLEALGSVRGRVVTRDGTPLPLLEVRLMNEIVYPNGGHSVGRLARTVSDSDGRFAFRGITDEAVQISIGTSDWVMVDTFQKVRTGDEDVVVRMKPASEGAGIRVILSVPPADDGTPVPGPIAVVYKVDGSPRGMSAGPKLDGDRWQFGFFSKPGTYDLVAHCVGFLPCEIRNVTIEDRPDAPPVVARFHRGAVVRLRALDETGEPLRGVSVSCGNLQMRTDERGECEVSGLEPGDRELQLRLVADHHVYGDVKVRAPGRADAVLRKHGYVHIDLKGRVYGDVRERLVWRLVDEEGRVVDESIVADSAEYQPGWRIVGSLRTTTPGHYRAVVEIDGKRAEAPVEIALGNVTKIELDPR